MIEKVQKVKLTDAPVASLVAPSPSNGGDGLSSPGSAPAVEAVSIPRDGIGIVEALQQQLVSIRRDAISVLRVTEELLQLPPEKRALRTRAERRASAGDGNEL